MPSLVDECERQYKVAAGEGALVELKMRLLADIVPELQRFAHDQKLENIETEIINHFSNHVNDGERETLALCRQLRNKILHGNFRVARQKLEQLGHASPPNKIRIGNIQDLSASEVRKTLQNMIDGVPGTFKSVADLGSQQPSTVFVWLLEACASRDLRRAAQCFSDATAIIERLAKVQAAL